MKNDLIDTPTVKSDGISNVYLTEDTKNLYAGADLSYNYKDVFYLMPMPSIAIGQRTQTVLMS